MKLDDETIKKGNINPLFLIVTLVAITICTYLITDHITAERIFMEDVEQEASIYDPNASGYKTSDKVKKTVKTIQTTSRCGDLKELYIENWNWYAKPMLAKKILDNC